MSLNGFEDSKSEFFGSSPMLLFLKFINSHLAKEDLAILLDGYRFSEGVETNHRHEQNETLTDTVRLIHLRLAEERNWQIINANQTIEQVHKAIWERVKKIIPSGKTPS